MRWTYTLGRVGETEIKLHLTFLLLVALWAAGGYEQAGLSGAVSAAITLIALFVCVVLHEFGHITMARRFGVRTPDVLILPIGGVARLERIPPWRSPWPSTSSCVSPAAPPARVIWSRPTPS